MERGWNACRNLVCGSTHPAIYCHFTCDDEAGPFEWTRTQPPFSFGNDACESRSKQLHDILSYTARPIASLGRRFLPFRNASSRISLCDFMLLFAHNFRREKPIPFLSPPRHLRPLMRKLSRDRLRPKRVRQCCRQHVPPSPEAGGAIRGYRFPCGGPDSYFCISSFSA